MLLEGSKIARGNASQFFVAGELCRRGHFAVVTLGNTPNTDILCSNADGTRFVHIQVKTFDPSKSKSVAVGKKAENAYGENFVWVLAGIPQFDNSSSRFEYYIVPAKVMSEQVRADYKRFIESNRRDGTPHGETSMRIVPLPPKTFQSGWSLLKYKDRWEIIDRLLSGCD
jgi:hypothetical protein